MTFEHYFTQPTQIVDFKLKMIIFENPKLTDALHRNVNHPLITKYSYIPFPY